MKQSKQVVCQHHVDMGTRGWKRAHESRSKKEDYVPSSALKSKSLPTEDGDSGGETEKRSGAVREREDLRKY